MSAAGKDGSGGPAATSKTCGLTELLIFMAAIVCGTACSICSKTMMQLHGVGITGEVEQFSKPLFQTFGMFIGMCFGLVLHWAAEYFRLPFPGYHWDEDDGAVNAVEGTTTTKTTTTFTTTTTKHTTRREDGQPNEMLPLVQSTTVAANSSNGKTLPVWMYFFLAVPSLFDTLATLLCMMGLRYIDVSIYQMLRGSGIIFVALMKQHVLRDRLYNF